MKRLSKAELVLEIYDREAMGEVTPREIAIINRGLIAELGEGGGLAPAEIASILSDEDLPVRFEQIFNMSSPEDRYERIFSTPVDLSSLEAAEASLRRLQSLRASLLERNDRRGGQYAMAIARAAKEQAHAAATSEDANAKEQKQQAEIAQWFTVWLQNPEVFDGWIELRKTTREYQSLLNADPEVLSED